MTQFEYYSFHGTPGDTIDNELDNLGAHGWEAFAMVPWGFEIVVYLKREKQ